MKSTRPVLCAVVGLALALSLTTAPLADEPAGDELIGVVVGLLGDKDKDLRALGLDQVRSGAKGQSATKRFAAELPKLSPDAQVGLLSALADRGDAAARPDVLKIFTSTQDEPVSVAAISALGFLGEPADVPRLVQSLGEGSKPEQAAARRSLVRLPGAKVPPAIAAEMTKSQPARRVALIEVLAARRALDTIPNILPAAVDADAKVRAAAMKALGELAGPEHLPGMVQGVLKADSSRERADAEKCVMFVCARIDDPQRRADPLLAAMDKLNAAERAKMLSTLGRVGGPAALKIIEEAIADDDSKRHEIGIKALANWPDASIAPRLIELAKTDDHASHQIAALRALIRVAPLSDKRTDAERLALLKQAMTMCTRDTERNLVLDRARAIRKLDTLHFILPYVEKAPYAQQACLSIVELAHHRTLREPNKAEFHRALDKVIETSKDAVVIDRATRYKKDQTWVRPKR